jgi:hypothetical protein
MGESIFFYFKYLTTEFGLAKEYYNQYRKDIFLYIFVLIFGNEFFGLKIVKLSLNRV